MDKPVPCILGTLALLVMISCGESGSSGQSDASTGDADADSDTDSDADTDTDSDVEDAGTHSDGGSDDLNQLCSNPDNPGPYAVGYKDILIEDTLRDGEFDARIVYPATLEGTDTPVDSAGGPYPLVIFSHGFSMYPEVYDYLTGHVASHGFIVLGTKHQDSAHHITESLAKLCGEIPIWEQLFRVAEMFNGIFETNHPLRRPADVTALIDAAEDLNLGDPMFQNSIDTSAVGAMGHSFGGFTSMATGGADIDVEGIMATCVKDPTLADLASNMLGVLICTLFDKVEEAELQKPLALQDERIKAAVSIAGPMETLWGEEFGGFDDFPNPILLIYTDTDEAVKYVKGAVPAYAALQSPKYFLTLKGGNHGNFGAVDAQSYQEIGSQIPNLCAYKIVFSQMAGASGQPKLAKADQHRLTRAGATAFLKRHLANNEKCSDYLTPDFFTSVGGDKQTFEGQEQVVDLALALLWLCLVTRSTGGHGVRPYYVVAFLI